MKTESDRKAAIVHALRRFINQRSGIEWANYYSCGDYKRSREAFMGDYRPILKHGREARQLLAVVANNDAITAAMIIEASKNAFSGRLTIVETDGSVSVDYCTGQYFPTEYRKAACAVLASCLWHHYDKQLPEPDGKVAKTHGTFTTEHASYRGLTAGEFIRKQARADFGRAIAATWFN